jgi:hypothetical protein
MTQVLTMPQGREFVRQMATSVRAWASGAPFVLPAGSAGSFPQVWQSTSSSLA